MDVEIEYSIHYRSDIVRARTYTHVCVRVAISLLNREIQLKQI